MKLFTFQTPIIEKHYRMIEGFFQQTPFAIVDNKVCNDLALYDWDYSRGVVIATGILYKDSIEVYVAQGIGDTDYLIAIVAKLKETSKLTMLHAFNAPMEQGNFTPMGLDLQIGEIKPFRAKGWTRDRFFQELIKRKVIPDVKIVDPLKSDEEVIIEYQRYLSDKDNEHLSRIAFHNLASCLRESLILRHRDYFREHWTLDKNGFMIGEKK